MFPLTKTRNEGTFAKTPFYRTALLLPLNDSPNKTFLGTTVSLNAFSAFGWFLRPGFPQYFSMKSPSPFLRGDSHLRGPRMGGCGAGSAVVGRVALYDLPTSFIQTHSTKRFLEGCPLWSTTCPLLIYHVDPYDLPRCPLWSSYFPQSAEISVLAKMLVDHKGKPSKRANQKR